MHDVLADYHAKNEWYYLSPFVREAISKHMSVVNTGEAWQETAAPLVLAAKNQKMVTECCLDWPSACQGGFQAE